MRPQNGKPAQRERRSTLVVVAASVLLPVLLGACRSIGSEATSGMLANGAAPGEDAPAGGEAADPSHRAESTAPLENTLRWKTASEVDNFGFDVYRGPSPDGPFERITAEPIPGAGTTDEPQYYVFVDDTIEAGRPYWYFVESISMMGARERFTPVFEAKAKGGEETGAEEARPSVGPDRDPGGQGGETGRRLDGTAP